jgi:hypothetical protein
VLFSGIPIIISDKQKIISSERIEKQVEKEISSSALKCMITIQLLSLSNNRYIDKEDENVAIAYELPTK